MEEHKIVSSGGIAKCEEEDHGTECIWELEGLTTKIAQKLREVMLGGCASLKIE